MNPNKQRMDWQLFWHRPFISPIQQHLEQRSNGIRMRGRERNRGRYQSAGWLLWCALCLHPAARCSHLSGSPSGKLVFILVEKAHDELVYLYAKEFCSHIFKPSFFFCDSFLPFIFIFLFHWERNYLPLVCICKECCWMLVRHQNKGPTCNPFSPSRALARLRPLLERNADRELSKFDQITFCLHVSVQEQQFKLP